MAKPKHFICLVNLCIMVIIIHFRQSEVGSSEPAEKKQKDVHPGLLKPTNQLEEITKDDTQDASKTTSLANSNEADGTIEPSLQGPDNVDESVRDTNQIEETQSASERETVETADKTSDFFPNMITTYTNTDGTPEDIAESSLDTIKETPDITDEMVEPFSDKIETTTLDMINKFHKSTPMTDAEEVQHSSPGPHTFSSSLISSREPDSITEVGTGDKHTWLSRESLKAKIQESLSQLCPTGRVCRETSIADPLPHHRHCCHECSCEATCGHPNRACCYENDVITENPFYDGPECLHVTSRDIDFSERHWYKAFIMESKCPSQNQQNIAANGSCGKEIVAPWGDLYPLYSKSLNKIFKNSACALCHGVTDGLTWDAYRICDMFVQNDTYNARQQNIANFESFLDGYNPENLCYVNFHPPVPWSVLESHQCVQEPVKTCPNEDFSTPAFLNLSKTAVIQACTSDFASPYTRYGAFNNVFCHICNSKSIIKDITCRELSTFPKVGPDSKFITLLDKSFLDEFKVNKVRHRKIPKACMSNKKCRPINCPNGKTYDRFGKCIFPTTKWALDQYEIYLKLKSSTTISKEIFLLNFYRNTFNISNVISPLKHRWIIKSLSYKESIEGSSIVIESFLATVKVRNMFKSPTHTLQAIKDYMEKKWYFHINGSIFEIHLAFAEIRDMEFLNGNIVRPVSIDMNSSQPEMKWNMIYEHIAFEGKLTFIAITKMFYCHQIELYKGEYDLLNEGHLLYYIARETYFYDGEFVIVVDTETDSHRPRICIEDSGFAEENDASAMEIHLKHMFSVLTITMIRFYRLDL